MYWAMRRNVRCARGDPPIKSANDGEGCYCLATAVAGRLIFESSSDHLRAFPYFAPAGALGVRGPVAVCLRRRGPWGGSVGGPALWGWRRIRRQGGGVQAFSCLHDGSPAGSAEVPVLVRDGKKRRLSPGLLCFTEFFLPLHWKGRECMSSPHSPFSNLPKLTTPRSGWLFCPNRPPDSLQQRPLSGTTHPSPD